MSTILTKNIWAVGRNYAKHAKEMQTDIPLEPFFFLKSGSSAQAGSKVSLPKWSIDVQHEIEIALRVDENLNYSHISLALDLTARDVQSLAKAKGLPWTLAKSFIDACPLGSWISLDEVQTFDLLSFKLIKNGLTVQKGYATDMLFKPKQLLEYLKMRFPLAPNDIILTGTPEGVGSLKDGDSLEGILQNDNRQILACHWDMV